MDDEKRDTQSAENQSHEEQTYEYTRQWARQYSRRDFLKLAGMFGGAAAFGSVLVGCQPSPTAVETTDEEAEGQEPETAAQFEAGGVQTGGVIRIARISDSDTLDPQKTSLLAAHEITTQIYDPLIYLDAAGEVYPALAESWEFSNENRTVTFKLREDVTFHDGSPLNAETVKWTVDRQLAPETASPTAWMLGPIDSVEAIDEYRVAYNYAEPFVPLWVGLSYSYCAPLSQSAVEAAGDTFGRNPVGTGPFKFVSWEPDQGITLEAYKEHTWASLYFKNSGPPYLDGAQYLIMPEDATRLAALQSGDIDMIAGSDAVPIDKIGQLEGTQGMKVATAPQAGLVYAYLNTTLPPLDDVRVRQAINYAVDKEKMIQLVLDGNAEPARSPVGSAFASMYTDELTHYDYDLDKARSLMAEAGQEGGFDVEFLLLDGAIFRRIGEVIQEDLSEININVQLQSLPVAELFAKAPERSSGLYFFWYTYSDADIVYQMLHSGESICWSFHENPELDQLIEAQRVEFDQDARREMFAQIQQIAVDEAYWLYLYEGKYVAAMKENVEGVEFDLLGFHHLQDMWMA